MKAARFLLYAFTIGCATTLLLFVLSVLSSIDGSSEIATSRAPATASRTELTPLKPSPVTESVDSNAERASKSQSPEDRSTKATSNDHGLTQTSGALVLAEQPAVPAGPEPTIQKDTTADATASARADLPKRRPISEATPEGHMVASHVIGLDIGAEYDALLEGVGLTFAFIVLDSSANRASEMQGLHGHLRLDFVVRAGLPDVATVFQRDPTVLRTIPLRIGRGRIPLFEALPDITQPTKPHVASAIYADFVPVNLLEAFAGAGAATSAPIWIEVDGYRTVLNSSETQHVLDVLSEAKQQHQRRWRAELEPGLGIRYVPR
jgi:hypothetical protein